MSAKAKNLISVLCFIAAVSLSATAAFFGWRIYRYYTTVNEQTAVFEEILEQVETAREDAKEDSPPADTQVGEEPVILAEYRELYEQNPDLVGWICIPDTVVNYPVMQSVDEPNYYLKHNFEKEYSVLGTPYVQENCDLDTSDNLILYAHHIKGGRMFAALEQYTLESFYREHKTIRFDTLTEEAEYEVLAVFKTVVYSAEGFRYYDFVDAENEEAFDAYIQNCKALALYDTGVTASYGDRLITLSTCEYSAENGRLVVVAKKNGGKKV